jgi:hypothetical protein
MSEPAGESAAARRQSPIRTWVVSALTMLGIIYLAEFTAAVLSDYEARFRLDRILFAAGWALLMHWYGSNRPSAPPAT